MNCAVFAYDSSVSSSPNGFVHKFRNNLRRFFFIRKTGGNNDEFRVNMSGKICLIYHDKVYEMRVSVGHTHSELK